MSLWGNKDSKTASGTITITKNSDGVTGNVVGSSTSFTTEAQVGNYILSGGNTYVITAISNTTFCTVKYGINGANVVAQTGGSAYTLSELPAFVALAEASENKSQTSIGGNAERVYGEAAGERGATSAVSSVTVTAAGSGYTVVPSATANNTGTSGTGATFTTTAKAVTLTINNPGTSGNYIPGETLTVSGGTGTAATANVTATEIRTIAIANAGLGYVNGDIVTVQTGTGTAANASVTTGAADTIPASLTIVNRGSYTVNPTLSAVATANTTGTGAGLTVNLTTRVKTATIKTGGSYTVLPTLTGAATTGSATGTGATIDSSIGLNTVAVSANGSGYVTAPTIIVGNTGGTYGAAATATASLIVSEGGIPSHAGWVKRIDGTGGRAGRTQYETLVAMGSITGDQLDDDKLPE